MAFYGFEHRYGANMSDDSGDLIGTLFIFKIRAARDAWLEDSNPYYTQPGARTPVKSRYAARFRRISGSVEHAA